jgi:hypothetical protein
MYVSISLYCLVYTLLCNSELITKLFVSTLTAKLLQIKNVDKIFKKIRPEDAFRDSSESKSTERQRHRWASQSEPVCQTKFNFCLNPIITFSPLAVEDIISLLKESKLVN